MGHAFSICADRTLNTEVWDAEGRRYIDFAGGISVLNSGYCHPDVMAAVYAQMERLTHTCFHVILYEPYVAHAEALNAWSAPLTAVWVAYFILAVALPIGVLV